LHELLGIVTVPGDQTQGAEQSSVLDLVEILEARAEPKDRRWDRLRGGVPRSGPALPVDGSRLLTHGTRMHAEGRKV
jgi:hypothetical protein